MARSPGSWTHAIPFSRGDFTVTHGHFLRMWGVPRASGQPESACRGPERPTSKASPGRRWGLAARPTGLHSARRAGC